MRPFVVKMAIKSFFAHLRLADTELAATRIYHLMEAMLFSISGHSKNLTRRCGEGHLMAGSYPHLGENRNFGHFWKTILADSVLISNLKTKPDHSRKVHFI